VSSFQPNSLPNGYTLRLATEQDSERILDFLYSQPNNVLNFLVALVFASWMLFYISEDKLRTFCIIFAGSILILLLLSLRVAEIRRSLEGKVRITQIVEYQNIICGLVTYLVFDRFVYIGGLLVDIHHRRSGIGSFMIQHCINTIECPIYLQCCPELKTFYERLGFTRVSPVRAPSELSILRSPKSYLMVATTLTT
jgi:N-acetylglutamate synthase-like GNAT family acetyltransferase